MPTSKDESQSLPKDDPRPIAGYGVLMVTYSIIATCATIAVTRRNLRLRPFGIREFVFYAIATQHLSRIVAKDSITAIIRKPFIEFEEATGEGEVNEKVTSKGIGHAIGELLTCPFCLGQWVATALVTGRLLFPEFTNSVVAISAMARTGDFLQIAYDKAKPS